MPAQAIPNKLDIPAFKSVVLYTGNVLRTSVAGLTQAVVEKKSNTELIHAIADTLQILLHSPEYPPSFRYFPDQSLLTVPDLRLQRSRISAEDRNDVEVTAKLFYLNDAYQTTTLDEALHHLRRVLGIDSVDTFIVSTSKFNPLVWQQLESYHRDNVLHQLGVADLDFEQLQAMLEDGSVHIKPSVNQINISSCSRMPSEMIDLARRSGVELLYNGDCSDILSKESLTKLLLDHGVVKGSTVILPRWVVKYHVFVRCRSIVADKGYIIMGDAVSS